MKKFGSLEIEPPKKMFNGDKISIYDVLNKEVIVHRFRIGPSKYQDKGNGIRMDLQLEIDNVERLLMTGSNIMMEQIKLVQDEDFPFTTTIIKLNPKGFSFT